MVIVQGYRVALHISHSAIETTGRCEMVAQHELTDPSALMSPDPLRGKYDCEACQDNEAEGNEPAHLRDLDGACGPADYGGPRLIIPLAGAKRSLAPPGFGALQVSRSAKECGGEDAHAQPLQHREPVDEKCAVEMVDLVLQADRRHA